LNVAAALTTPNLPALVEILGGAMADGDSTPPKWPFRRWARSGWDICSSAWGKAGTWLYAVLATVAAPCLPVGIEFLQTGKIAYSSFYITGAVMSAAFAVSAESIMFLAFYMGLFVVNLILDTVTGPYSAAIGNWAGTILFAVALLHMTERGYWHFVLDRPFPDRKSKVTS
jgi:hypothetical protein